MALKVVPGEIDPDTYPSLPCEQLVEIMRAPLKAEYLKIDAKIKEQERRTLLTEHELGERVHRLHRDEERYGNRAMQLVAAACGVDPTRLYRAIQFYSFFPVRKDVEKLMARRGDREYRLTWGHSS